MNDYTVYMHISPSGKRYIGITCQEPKRRWQNGRGYKRNKYFYRAIEKYGWDNFQHIIIAKGLSEDEAKWLEIELIRIWNSSNPNNGYNISLGGEGGSGVRHTEERKQEQSKKMKGKSNPMYGKNAYEGKTEEEIKEISRKKSIANSGKSNPMYGKNPLDYMTEEAKIKRSKKISESMRGEKHHRARAVICITTKKIFSTLTDGGKHYGCDRQSIYKCCKGKQKSAGKLDDGTPLVWRYIVYNHNKRLRPIENKIKR